MSANVAFRFFKNGPGDSVLALGLMLEWNAQDWRCVVLTAL